VARRCMAEQPDAAAQDAPAPFHSGSGFAPIRMTPYTLEAAAFLLLRLTHLTDHRVSPWSNGGSLHVSEHTRPRPVALRFN